MCGKLKQVLFSFWRLHKTYYNWLILIIFKSSNKSDFNSSRGLLFFLDLCRLTKEYENDYENSWFLNR